MPTYHLRHFKKKMFGFNKTKFYRILRFGLPFFNKKNNGVFIDSNNGILIIEVIRNVNKVSSLES